MKAAVKNFLSVEAYHENAVRIIYSLLLFIANNFLLNFKYDLYDFSSFPKITLLIKNATIVYYDFDRPRVS